MAGNLTIRERKILREYLERQARKDEIRSQLANGSLTFFSAQRQLRALEPRNRSET